MAEYRGFVKKIGTKSGKGKKPPYRPWTAYSVKLEKEDGTEYEEWLSLGFDEPAFKEGDFVKMNAEKDAGGYMKVDAGSVQIAKNPPARGKCGGTSGEAGGNSSRGNYSGGGVDYNSATARAIELVDLLIKHDGVTLSAAKGAGGAAKRNAEIVAMVDKYTVKLYNDIKTLRILETVADTVTDTKADGELPEREGDEAEGDDDDNF